MIFIILAISQTSRPKIDILLSKFHHTINHTNSFRSLGKAVECFSVFDMTMLKPAFPSKISFVFALFPFHTQPYSDLNGEAGGGWLMQSTKRDADGRNSSSINYADTNQQQVNRLDTGTTTPCLPLHQPIHFSANTTKPFVLTNSALFFHFGIVSPRWLTSAGQRIEKLMLNQQVREGKKRRKGDKNFFPPE